MSRSIVKSLKKSHDDHTRDELTLFIMSQLEKNKIVLSLNKLSQEDHDLLTALIIDKACEMFLSFHDPKDKHPSGTRAKLVEAIHNATKLAAELEIKISNLTADDLVKIQNYKKAIYGFILNYYDNNVVLNRSNSMPALHKSTGAAKGMHRSDSFTHAEHKPPVFSLSHQAVANKFKTPEQHKDPSVDKPKPVKGPTKHHH